MNEDLMFTILKRFKMNAEFSEIAIAMDAAFMIGNKRAAFTPISDEQSLSMMQEKCKKLGIRKIITINDITT